MKKLFISLSAACLVSFFVQDNVSYAEATYEKAQHRLPPVIYSLDIPKTVQAGDSYDFNWTVMGYHDKYDIKINVYNASGKKIASDTVSPDNITIGEDGLYHWDNIQSRRFYYSTNLALNFSGYQELTVRFFASPVDDPIDNSLLSCLVPGGLGYKAADSTGRKINIYGVPSDSVGLDIGTDGYFAGAVDNNYLSTDKAYRGFDNAYLKIFSIGDNSRITIRFIPQYDKSTDTAYSYKFVLPWDIKVSSFSIANSKQVVTEPEKIEELAIVRDEVIGKILGAFSFPINLFFASIPTAGDPPYTSYIEGNDIINKYAFPYQTFQGLFSRQSSSLATQFVINCDMSIGEVMQALNKYKMSFYVGSTPGNELFIEGLRVK